MARYEINESVTEPRAVFGTDLSTVQAAVPKNGAPVVARDAGTTTSRALYAAASGGSALTQPILTVNGRIEAYVEGETPVDLLINYGLSNQYTQRFTPPQVGPAGPAGGADPVIGAKFFRDTYASGDEAVVASFIGNRSSNPTTQVLGTPDPSTTAERPSVGIYFDNATRNPPYLVNSTATTFTATTVTYAAGVDLSRVRAKMIVDVGNADPFVVGVVQSVAGQTVTVNSWRQNGASASTPSNGTRAYVDRVAQVWAMNGNVFSEYADDAQPIVGFEFGVKMARDDSPTLLANTEGAVSRGFDIIALASAGVPYFGQTIRGRFKHGLSISGIRGDASGRGSGIVVHNYHQPTPGASFEAALLDEFSPSVFAVKRRSSASTDGLVGGYVGSETTARFSADVNGKLFWALSGSAPDLTFEHVSSAFGKFTGKVAATAGLGVGNSATATTPGSVVKKMQVFDAAGASLGYVAIFDAIS